MLDKTHLSSTSPALVQQEQEIDKDIVKPLSAAQCQPQFTHHIKQLASPENAQLSLLFEPAVSVINSYLALPTQLLLINSNHWETARQLLNQLLPESTYSNYLLSYDQETLFGRVSINQDNKIDFNHGELNHAANGILMLSISPLLVSPALWFLLKSVLQRGYFAANEAMNAEKIKLALPDFSEQQIKCKIILVANRYQLEELSQIDPEYGQVSSLFCELPSQVTINNNSIEAVVAYCQNIAEEQGNVSIDKQGMVQLLTHLSQLAGHQNKLYFSPEIIKQCIGYAYLFSNKHTITADNFISSLEEIENAQSLAREYSEESIQEGQINLQLSGDKIGQINGLSVVELLGYPCEFGEVFRVSASDMLGDGEIIDVERKVDLAGNIHAKSTLIVQGYLNHFFSHITAFPYSCNLVFEQSYQESDGDSASLAILLAVSSCYSQIAVKQDVFVTGALDQHGNVLAIGGINHKIRAVTRLFEMGLLTQPISIVLPAANQINLTLDKSTLSFVQQGKIKILAIAHCHQAYPLLLGKSFKFVLEKIEQRIEKTHKDEHERENDDWFKKLKTMFFKHHNNEQI